MKIIKRNLSEDMKEVKILALSDMHIGDQLCNLKKIKEVLEEVKKSENTYIILNGDLINNATTSSVSNTYGEKMTPMEQIVTLCDLLEPIKDKILVISEGNHERRTEKEDGISIIGIVAKQLKIEDRYANGWWYLYLSLGLNERKKDRQMLYTLTGYHGSGGGKRPGGKANSLNDMSKVVVADIYITGHTHQSILLKDSIFVPDLQHKTLIKKEKFYMNTCSFLEYGGYAEQYNFTPSTIDENCVVLDGTKKKIKMMLK